jgi:hypothetical protein
MNPADGGLTWGAEERISSVNREATNPFAGQYCARTDLVGLAEYAQFSQPATLPADRPARVTVRYRHSGAATSYIRIRNSTSNVWLTAAGTWVGVATDIALPNSAGWHEFQMEFTAHASYTAYVVEAGSDATGALGLSAYFDDISIDAMERDYLESVSISLGGAGMDPAPIAGTWGATLDNKDGLFHPFHPTSPYKNLLRLGREVRISVGGNYGGVDYYWQRLIGFMDSPRFNHGSHTVELNGMDYMKLLADTKIRESEAVSETEFGSGSASASVPSGPTVGDVSAYYHGPSHWGERITFDSHASPGGTGGEIYAEADACEIGAGEADNVTNWTATGGAVTSEGPAQESDYMLQFVRDLDGPTEQYAQDTDVGSITAGAQYTLSLWARVTSLNGAYAVLLAQQSVGGTIQTLGQKIMSDGADWVQYSFIITAATTGELRLKLRTGGSFALTGDIVELDEISVRLYDPTSWMMYDMPPNCNGPYFVTLDGEPLWQGDADGKNAWHYDEAGRTFYLSEGMTVNAGVNNLHVYYYTTQVVENVLADLLVHAGL